MKLLSIVLLAIISFTLNSQEMNKFKLLYVYDPLCGWCYGFSPIINQFYNNHLDQLDAEVISGGMILGDRVGVVGQTAPYIAWAYKDVENHTGIKFGEQFLEHTFKSPDAVFNSLPPCKAMIIYKEKFPAKQMNFASKLQSAIYYDGIYPENLEQLAQVAHDNGFDKEEFTAKMNDEKYLLLTENDFALSRGLQVSGFPCVFILHDEKYYIIAQGAVSLEKLESSYKLFLEQVQK